MSITLPISLTAARGYGRTNERTSVFLCHPATEYSMTDPSLERGGNKKHEKRFVATEKCVLNYIRLEGAEEE